MPNVFDLTILGSNSSYPFHGRMCTSQILRVDQNLYMIDCGEGTQIQLSKFSIQRNKIKTIFLSHFHGDHLYGLPGMITSYMHFGRKEPLHIFGPAGLKKYLETVFEVSNVYLQFELILIETVWDVSGLIFEDQHLQVFNFPLDHRIPTQGFIFKTKETNRNIIPEKIQEFGLTHQEIKELKAGNTIVTSNGITVTTENACFPPKPDCTYVFASDTKPISNFPELAYDCNLLYHEATYLADLETLAIERGHSTSTHAATAAKEIRAKKLMLGHFSSRYDNLNPFLAESKLVFENTILAIDGETHAIN